MPKVTIYTDTWGGADWIPHTFLGITDKNGNTIYRGFSPDKTKLGFGVMVLLKMTLIISKANHMNSNMPMKLKFHKSNMMR